MEKTPTKLRIKNHFKKVFTVKNIARLGIFLAIGIVLNIIESFIPVPIPVPGVRLGLANTIGLIILYYYSPLEFIIIGFLRVLLVGLLRTGLFSYAFSFSLAGWGLSSLVVLIFYLFKKFSIYGLSITSAIFHGFGQLLVAILLYEQRGLSIYFAFLLLTGIISGTLTALISQAVIKKLNKTVEIDYDIDKEYPDKIKEKKSKKDKKKNEVLQENSVNEAINTKEEDSKE